MAPKAKARGRAKPKARAKPRGKAAALRRLKVQLAASNAHLGQRRAAARELNKLVAEVVPSLEKLDPKNVDKAVFEKHLRQLNRRCTEGVLRARFETAVLQWVNNKGKLPEGVSVAAAAGVTEPVCLEAEDEDLQTGISVLPRHKVLLANYTLKSKAFMLTHNCRLFTKATWPGYRDWVRGLSKKYQAKAWAACLERSENAACDQGEVYHTHAYFFLAGRPGHSLG